MAHAYHHAVSSARAWGGTPDDYLQVHAWLDSSKLVLADFRHRMLHHHAEGCWQAERLFGVTISNSAGRTVPVRLIAERHIKEDLGRIPSLADWACCIRPEPWMGRTGGLATDADASPTAGSALDRQTDRPVRHADGPINEDRADWALAAVRHHAFLTKAIDETTLVQLRDLLCNLLHLSDRLGVCLHDEISRQYEGNYLEEIAEHPAAHPDPALSSA